ncbi:hypothetical protein [Streptomyces sp. NPDC002952]|uniref:hypothetical protein n=1 Tax=Streptomyces sp. NPDC002952 TaxID=3364673 RepID=UPI00367E700B
MIYKLMGGRRVRVVPMRGEDEGTYEFETYHFAPAPDAQRVTDSVEYLSGEDAEARIAALRIGDAIRFGAVYGGGPELASTGRPSRTSFRAGVVAASVATVAAMGVVVYPNPQAPDGPSLADVVTAPVVTPSPVAPKPYRPEPHTSREGEREALTQRVPHLVTQSTKPATPRPVAKPPADIRVSFYRDCSSSPQPCIDAGALTMYAGRILAGHNYMGYQWLSRVPVGRTVRVVSGPLAGTYKVYGHLTINRQGGQIPDFPGSPSLVLQSCEGDGTGFSLLHRA